ncbi:hypothetical protein Tco_0548716 [Tanacetum coccineum]
MDLSASSKLILVGFGSPKLIKLPGSFSLDGSLFNKTAEHLSFIVTVQASSNLALFDSRPFRNLVYFGICARALVQASFNLPLFPFSIGGEKGNRCLLVFELSSTGLVVDFPPLVVTPLASHPTIWALLIALDSPYISNSSSLSTDIKEMDIIKAKRTKPDTRKKECEKPRPKFAFIKENPRQEP